VLNFQDAAHRRLVELLIVDWAIKELEFESLMDALIASLAETVSDRFGDAFNEYKRDPAALEQIAIALEDERGSLSDEEIESWFSDYLRCVGSVEPSLIDCLEDECSLQERFADSLQRWGRDCSSSDGTHQLADSVECEACVAIATGGFSRDNLLLAPIQYLIHQPFWPMDSWAGLHERVVAAVEQREDGMELEGDLVLENDGAMVRSPFLRVVSLADARLISNGGAQRKTYPLSRVMPRLRMLAHATPRADYVRLRTESIFMDEDGSVIHSRGWPQLNSEVAKAKVLRAMPDAANRPVSWVEIAAKLALISLEAEPTEQEVSAQIHAEVVRLLRRAKRAMTSQELEAALGISLPFRPETLPPGRIMAYARHPRFLRPENAVYVLREWVESESKKRGLILRDRIVTPFSIKCFDFDAAEVHRHLEREPLFVRFGLFSIVALANSLALSLPSKPTELYYRFKIKKRLQSMLRGEFADIGLDFFASYSAIPPRTSGEPMYLWRRRIVQHALGFPTDVDVAIRQIEEARVRSSLYRLLKQRDLGNDSA